MEGTRPPTGASPTQPYKCGQYFKVKINVKTSAVFDFNILTAFIRLGRARPVGAGCPSSYFSSGITIVCAINALSGWVGMVPGKITVVVSAGGPKPCVHPRRSRGAPPAGRLPRALHPGKRRERGFGELRIYPHNTLILRKLRRFFSKN